MATTDHYVGEVVEYRPPVTGGIITGVITAIGFVPYWGTVVTFRVTDGTVVYPPGLVHSVAEEDLHELTP